MARHGYDNGIIFGHAKDGNLHFVITQSFNDQRAIDQYSRLIDDVVELVVHRFDGALKAEHGTGRNMAPFVETEWGGEAYQIMRRLKSLADPTGLLNPGVILNSDPRAHLHNLKRFPTVEPEIDKCIECGYCEPRCPSRDLTLTPRQRIVVRREMACQQQLGGSELFNQLDRDFPYMVLDTCAADGLCATTCPVNIDTGKLVKRFRALRNSPRARRIAQFTVEKFALQETLIRLSLTAAHLAERVIGVKGVQKITGAMRKRIGPSMPLWSAGMPYRNQGRHSAKRAAPPPRPCISPLASRVSWAASRRAQRNVSDAGDRRIGQTCRSPRLDSRRRCRKLLWHSLFLKGL